MTPDRGDQERAREARRILDQVTRESDGVAGSALARAGARARDHFAGQDAVGEGEGGATDPIELRGRRIGRALSLVLGLGLVLWLSAQLGWWR